MSSPILSSLVLSLLPLRLLGMQAQEMASQEMAMQAQEMAMQAQEMASQRSPWWRTYCYNKGDECEFTFCASDTCCSDTCCETSACHRCTSNVTEIYRPSSIVLYNMNYVRISARCAEFRAETCDLEDGVHSYRTTFRFTCGKHETSGCLRKLPDVTTKAGNDVFNKLHFNLFYFIVPFVDLDKDHCPQNQCQVNWCNEVLKWASIKLGASSRALHDGSVCSRGTWEKKICIEAGKQTTVKWPKGSIWMSLGAYFTTYHSQWTLSKFCKADTVGYQDVERGCKFHIESAWTVERLGCHL